MTELTPIGSGSAASIYEISKTQPGEHARTWLLTAIQLIPNIGGALGTLLQATRENH